ncbi:hypothetical protein SEVIR_7G047565v4 [Setaria viridis]|uniref:Uncharacterized protein n=1 Tax=Setaria viridis TaxID=4556 RepID=A0A4U6U0J9_SETVI|nr:hypothetical protein SEVIR_7G047565v2 [Setaria viridis]
MAFSTAASPSPFAALRRLNSSTEKRSRPPGGVLTRCTHAGTHPFVTTVNWSPAMKTKVPGSGWTASHRPSPACTSRPPTFPFLVASSVTLLCALVVNDRM